MSELVAQNTALIKALAEIHDMVGDYVIDNKWPDDNDMKAIDKDKLQAVYDEVDTIHVRTFHWKMEHQKISQRQ